jgi:hypothetical protein
MMKVVVAYDFIAQESVNLHDEQRQLIIDDWAVHRTTPIVSMQQHQHPTAYTAASSSSFSGTQPVVAVDLSRLFTRRRLYQQQPSRCCWSINNSIYYFSRCTTTIDCRPAMRCDCARSGRLWTDGHRRSSRVCADG